MSILPYQIHLQRHERFTAPGSASHTTLFVAYGFTSYSLEIGLNCVCVPTMSGSLHSRLILIRYAAPRNNWESKTLYLLSTPSAMHERPNSALECPDRRMKPLKEFREYNVPHRAPFRASNDDYRTFSHQFILVFFPSSPLSLSVRL